MNMHTLPHLRSTAPLPLFWRFSILSMCLLLLFLAATGCSLKNRSGSRHGVELFPPMRQAGVAELDKKTAAQLTAQLHLESRGQELIPKLQEAIRHSLAHARRKDQTELAVNMPGLALRYADLRATLEHMQHLLPRLARTPSLLVTEFTWYRIGPDFSCTGYFEPTLEASRTPSAAYPYPLYRVPRDVRKGVPYWTRHEIDRQHKLANRQLEIAWVSSEVEAFFLHIQGSGRLRFPDGTVSHVLYAGKNNRAYSSLGRIMKEEGLLAPNNISMQSIRKTLASLPLERQHELLDSNASYVFFHEADNGPLGSMGYPLTPWVSIATDRTVLPHGLLTYSILPLPDEDGSMNIPFYGLTLPQDTGGAIKKQRIDLFCGAGEEAAHTAGYLNAKGATYILVKKAR